MKTFTLLVVFFTFVFSAHGQTPRAAARPLRSISALSLTQSAVPPLFFSSAPGKYAPFEVGHMQRGSVNQLPAETTLRLFREESKDAQGKPVMVPAIELPLPGGENPLLLAFFHETSGQVAWRLLQDDPERHTAGMVRIINLSAGEVYCKVDDSVLAIAPKDETSPPIAVKNTRGFTMTYGMRLADGTVYQSPVKKLQLPRDDMRLLVIFASHNDGDSDLVLRDARIYDRVKEPRAIGTLARSH
jgi:hypothetical protein